jgi:4-hydroxybenzoate polyprenyltransferase
VTRTRPITLVLFAVVGAAAGWLLQVALVAMGSPAAVPSPTLALALLVIGVLVVAFAVPVRRAVRDRENHRVDPFYATRVVVLAKASSVAGSLLTGGTLAIIVFLLTRSVVVGVGSVLAGIAAVIGAVALLVGGLIAERMCSIPPHDGDDGDENPATARPH